MLPSFIKQRKKTQLASDIPIKPNVNTIHSQPITMAAHHRKDSLVSTNTIATQDKCNDKERRDSLAEIEEGPSLQQIADETGVSLHILIKLNSAPPCTPSACATSSPVHAQVMKTNAPPRRSQRLAAHHVPEAFVCECEYVAGK